MVLQVKQNVTHIQTVSKLKSWNDEDGARTAGTGTILNIALLLTKCTL